MRINSKPVTKTFPIKADTEEGCLTVTLRQATFGEDMERADAYAVQRTYYPTAIGERAYVEENRNRARSMAKEIKSVLSGIGGLVDEKGNPLDLFRFKEHRSGFMKVDMTDEQFTEALWSFPAEVVEEIHDHVLEMNPTWGKTRAQLEKEQSHGEEPKTPEGESKTTSET